MKVHQKNTEVYSGLISISQKGAIFTVNIETPTGGTLVVMNGETQISNGDAVADGTTLTITPTAADGYRFRNWQAVDNSTHTYTTTFTYKINEKDVTIKANFDKEYSVNWSINGNVESTSIYIKDDVIIFPNRPADVQGKKFVGWTATEISGTQAAAPTLLAGGAKMGTSDVTYYAVFADVTSGESSTATLTESEITTKFTDAAMAYANDPKSYEDASDNVTWVARGFADKDSKWVQLKSANNAYFKVSTTSKNIEEVKLTITGNSPNGATGQVISNNTDFEGTVCIETKAESTPIGSCGSSNEVSNKTVTVTLSIPLSEFFIQTTAGARVWGIELTTNNYTYSNYCTAVSVPATISAAEYATFVNSNALDFSGTGVNVYTARDMGSYVKLNEITSGQVPAGTPVVLYKEGADGTAIDVPVIASAEPVGDNDLAVVTTEGGMEGVANMFVLSKPAGKEVGFYAWKVGAILNKGKVYLQGKATSARDFLGFNEGNTTAIDNVVVKTVDANAPMYNLAGQRVNKSYKGVVIVNGKKMLNK